MAELVFRSVDEGISVLTKVMKAYGEEAMTRNGPVLVLPETYTIMWRKPQHHVIMAPERDANPFLFLFDGLHVLSGRSDVAFLAQFSKQFHQYSDDGITLRGAYGERLRSHFTYDQLEALIEKLKRDPTDRRTVLGLWDPVIDLTVQSKDVPCNLMIHVRIRNEAVNITVFNRSNDLYWGMCGANAVQFGMLIEYLAMRLRMRVGTYTQITTNLHAYLEFGPWQKLHAIQSTWFSPYDTLGLVHVPMIGIGEHEGDFDNDMTTFFYVDEPVTVNDFRTYYFRNVIMPMLNAWNAWKEGERDLDVLKNILGYNSHSKIDWLNAAVMWFSARVS